MGIFPKTKAQEEAEKYMDSVAVKAAPRPMGEKKVKRDGTLETDEEQRARLLKGE